MIATKTSTSVLDLLAQLIDYPTPELRVQAEACSAALNAQRSRAIRPLEAFRRAIEQMALSRLEELYVATFELTPVCYPYIGYQLFGDTYKRGEFLVQLNARYRAIGFIAPGELPDHLGVILRYLAQAWDADLVTEGVIPSLERMDEQLANNPYRDLLRAMLIVLRRS